MNFNIRPIDNETDHEFIRNMNTRLVEVIEAPTHCTQEVIAFQESFTESAWDKDNGSSATFIAIAENGQKLGYVNVRETDDEIAQEKCGYIALLAVTREAEGGGVAQRLVAEAENWARQMGFNRLCLDVFASNQQGRRFYEKAGFEPETIRVIKRL